MNASRIKSDVRSSGFGFFVLAANAVIAMMYREYVLCIAISLFAVILLLHYIMQLLYIIAFRETKE